MKTETCILPAAAVSRPPCKFWSLSRIYQAAGGVFYFWCVVSGWYSSHPTDQHWYNFDADVHTCVMVGSIALFVEWRSHRVLSKTAGSPSPQGKE